MPYQNGYYFVGVTLRGRQGGLRTATAEDEEGGRWRIASYPEGGWSVNVYRPPIGWFMVDGADMPLYVRNALCAALGITWE